MMPELKEFIGEEHQAQLMDEIELLDGAQRRVRSGAGAARESFPRYSSVPH